MNKLLALAARLMNPILAGAVPTDKSSDGERGSTGMRRAAICMASVLFLYPASASAIQCAPPPTALDYAFCQDAGLRNMVEEGAQIIQKIWPRLNSEQQQRLQPDQAAWRERTMTACGLRTWSGIIAPEIMACLRREVSARNQVLHNLVAEASVVPPAQLHTPMPPAAPQRSAALADDHGGMYQKGLDDRAAWEAWFNSLQPGDFKTGAFYWVSQRSLPHPGSCQQMNAEFTAGCTATKSRLDPSDTLRRSQPDYKLGWNAWASPVQNSLQQPSATEPIVCRNRYNPSPVTAEEGRAGTGHVYYGCEPSAAPTASNAPPPAAEATVAVPAPTAAQDGAIRQYCSDQWPGDFEMRAYCERKQREAVETLAKGLPKDISANDFAIIRGKCAADWPDNFEMRAYCERKQYGAVHLLGQTTAAPLPRSVRSPPASDAGREEMFISVVQEATQRYKSAENDMAKGGVRAWRKEAICRLLPSLAVDSWNGEIYSLSSNSEGKGVVEIMIAPNIYMKTWNNSLSDSHDHTLIDPNSRVFQVLSGMKKGDHIRFSGSFSPSEADCVGEPSLTQNGSMSEPEFIFQFSAVSAQ